ncbi:arachidonate 5-lipoxygenase-activating protein [Callorhinchus milii]|uniref:Arachidonate 5-lipoxygenase-activating protein n=1 Tax=Callorhinchus milii TaxID=7868 RepID=K4GG93_CALMI|nr:arachidonate 5-lipoxygenase-activating protein [Callorhinchus milii]AFM89153.1 Arachidonate 5-lipoxygenase-activating protein [Callorhinchus milii]|eukprot:gi/632948239/ref/XP_007889481.1/ PREDICTED: arachidonate 5-lipoxygenase-activating protein [Callorhinchus milii]
MDSDIQDDVVLLGIVTLLSALQNVFFAYKVEIESKMMTAKSSQRSGFDRVSIANHNCIEVYPTFIVLLWSAGVFCTQAPAAFAGLLYLVVRHKYFIGYLGESNQSLPGFIFGKRLMAFLFIMASAGLINYVLNYFCGVDFLYYIQTASKASAALLLIP